MANANRSASPGSLPLPGPAAVAAIAILLAILCQWLMVKTAYDGNWTALFCAGDQFTRPAEIQSHEYVFRGIGGYDGQFYQLIAHDPLLLRRSDAYIDAPRLRYRRILMSGLAYLLAAGHSDWIDDAYYVVCWGFLALGTFCLGQLALLAGRSSFWGLLFLITPATLSAVERMTVDVSLSALVLAVLLAARTQRWSVLWVALAACGLSKETGVLVVAAVALWTVRQGAVRRAALLACSLLPAIGWYLYIQSRTHGDFNASEFEWFSAYLSSLTQPLAPGPVNLIFRIATGAAMIGFLAAAMRSIFLAISDRFHDLGLILCVAFALVLLLLQNSALWQEANGFARIYSPMLVLLIASTWSRGFRLTLVLFAAAACPLCLQVAAHVAGPVWSKL